MTSVYFNGGVRGVTLDFGAEDQYITGTTTGRLTPVYVGGQTRTVLQATDLVTNFALTGGVDTLPRQGDIVIIAVAIASVTNRAFNISGYTQIADLFQTDTEATNLFIGYKIMGATPDTSFTLTSGSYSTTQAGTVAVHVWRNIDQTTPLDVTPTTALHVSTIIPNPPSITPTTTKSVIIAVGGAAHTGGVDTFGATYLSNFITIGNNSTDDSTVGMGSLAWTGGAYDPAAWTCTQATSTAFSAASATIALRPALGDIPVLGNKKNSGIWNLQAVYGSVYIKPGQQVFTSSSSFVVPANVKQISAVVVGGGGGGGGNDDSDETGGGGGGGALAYNTFAVTPGETLTITVGAAGTGGNASGAGGAGGQSNIQRAGVNLVAANGGSGGAHRGNGGAGGTVSVGTGGSGGTGGAGSDRSSNNGGGGGGAGGYSGNGGAGGGGTSSGASGSGGGGGGGGGGTNNATRGGGGVGILGAGSNGAGGAANTSGSGGSGGSNGTNVGGNYGGGGRGAAGTSQAGSAGSIGAVRIIWGPGRLYPSTSVGDQ
jgi:hypothetical protein